MWTPALGCFRRSKNEKDLCFITLYFVFFYYYLYEKNSNEYEHLSSLKDEIVETSSDKVHINYTQEEEKKYGIYREDRAFGDALFLLEPGIQIVPSDMGGCPMKGMHGFSPGNEHSFAAILSNEPLPQKTENVADYFNFMIERAENL